MAASWQSFNGMSMRIPGTDAVRYCGGGTYRASSCPDIDHFVLSKQDTKLRAPRSEMTLPARTTFENMSHYGKVRRWFRTDRDATYYVMIQSPTL